MAQLVRVACGLEYGLADMEFQKEVEANIQDRKIAKLEKKFLKKRSEILREHELYQQEVQGKVGSSYAVNLKQLHDRMKAEFDRVAGELQMKENVIESELAGIRKELASIFPDSDAKYDKAEITRFTARCGERVQAIKQDLRAGREDVVANCESFSSFLNLQRVKAKEVIEYLSLSKMAHDDELRRAKMRMEGEVSRLNMELDALLIPKANHRTIVDDVRDCYGAWNELVASRVSMRQMMAEFSESQNVIETLNDLSLGVPLLALELDKEYESLKELASHKIRATSAMLDEEYELTKLLLDLRHRIQSEQLEMLISQCEDASPDIQTADTETDNVCEILQSQIQALRRETDFLRRLRSQLDEVTTKYETATAEGGHSVSSMSAELGAMIDHYNSSKSNLVREMEQKEVQFKTAMEVMKAKHKRLPGIFSEESKKLNQAYEQEVSALKLGHVEYMDKMMQEFQTLKQEVLTGNSSLQEASQMLLSKNTVDLMNLDEFCRAQISKHKSESLGMTGFYDERIEVLQKQRDILKSTVEDTARPEEAEKIVALRKELKTLNKKYTNLLIQLSDLAPEAARAYPPPAFEETKPAARSRLTQPLARRVLLRRPR